MSTEAKKRERVTIIAGIIAVVVFVPIFATSLYKKESPPPAKSAQFEDGFKDGVIAGRADATEKTGKRTWEQREKNAQILSSDPEYQKGWRAGYDAGFQDISPEGS